MANLTSILDELEAGRDLELRKAPDNTFPMLDTLSPPVLTNTLRLIREVTGDRFPDNTRDGEPRSIFVIMQQQSNTTVIITICHRLLDPWSIMLDVHRRVN